MFASVSVRTLNNILLRHICIYHKIVHSVPLSYPAITSSYVLECLGISDDWPDESMRRGCLKTNSTTNSGYNSNLLAQSTSNKD